MISKLLAAWNRFFFEPLSPEPIALFRICYGLLSLQFAWLICPDLLVWFGKKGIISIETVYCLSRAHGLNVLNFAPDDDIWLYTVFASFVLGAFFMTIGLATRFSAILMFIGYISLHHRNPYLLNGGDNYVRLVALYMIFSQAGRKFSVDAWLARKFNRQPSFDGGPWAQRMIQIQLSILYAAATLFKLTGVTWRSGTAVWYSSHLLEFRRFPVPYIYDHMWTINLLTYATLVIEFCMFTVVWLPRFRYYILAVTALLHLTIDYSMNIPQFQYFMLSSYILFIEPQHLQRAKLWLKNAFGNLTKPLGVLGSS
jgi:hypothetical protein